MCLVCLDSWLDVWTDIEASLSRHLDQSLVDTQDSQDSQDSQDGFTAPHPGNTEDVSLTTCLHSHYTRWRLSACSCLGLSTAVRGDYHKVTLSHVSRVSRVSYVSHVSHVPG